MKHIIKTCMIIIILVITACSVLSNVELEKAIKSFSFDDQMKKGEISIYLIADDCYCPSIEYYEIEILDSLISVNVRQNKVFKYSIEEELKKIRYRHINFKRKDEYEWKEFLVESADNSGRIFLTFLDNNASQISEDKAIETIVELRALNERLGKK